MNSSLMYVIIGLLNFPADKRRRRNKHRFETTFYW